MAPISRLAVIAMLFSAAFVSARPLPPEVPVFHKRAPAPASSTSIITTCTTTGTIALTFDDGPQEYTNELLDLLKARGAKATFFVNGHNNGDIAEFAGVVKRAYDEGHQIASHTYSHKDLATLDKAGIISEMTQLDTVLKTIIGVSPIYMRVPYGSYNDFTVSTLTELGYKIVDWDQDTKDWEHPENVEASLSVYRHALNAPHAFQRPGHIFLQHDTNRETSLSLAPRAVDIAISLSYRVVTVGECLGELQANWYRA
ncbi:hypothetical protein BGX26_003633 [Mortierella sp. AD094]|nr:hypothetical protein BGX26_003633 [Mortierella sp. AD094]